MEYGVGEGTLFKMSTAGLTETTSPNDQNKRNWVDLHVCVECVCRPFWELETVSGLWQDLSLWTFDIQLHDIG